MDFLFSQKVDERIERLVRAAENIAAAVRKTPKEAYQKLKASGEIGA